MAYNIGEARSEVMEDMTMKIMFISDIHGSETCLDAALERYEAEKPNMLVISGDILYHGPRNPIPEGYNPKGVIEKLNPLKDKILAVRGNCDSEVDQMVLEFPVMADFQQMYVDGRSIYVSHGHLYNNEMPGNLKEETIYVQGHTHIPMIQTEGSKTHFNPGSITLPKNNEPKTYGVYEAGNLFVKTMDGKIHLAKSFN